MGPLSSSKLASLGGCPDPNSMEYHVRSRCERDGVSLWRCVTDDVQRRDFLRAGNLVAFDSQASVWSSCLDLLCIPHSIGCGMLERSRNAPVLGRRSFVAKVAYGVAATLTGYACWPQVRRGCLKPVP